MMMILTWWKTIALLSLGLQSGLGTVFWNRGPHGEVDPGNPQAHLACLHRDLRDATDAVVAHPTLPCNSKVWIMNPRTGRSTVAIVGDRGPLHALLDMSRLVARRLHHNGHERIVFMPLGPRPPVLARLGGR